MKFKNPFTPSSFDLVVTRHAGLRGWLLAEGYIDESTPVVEHAHAHREDVMAVEYANGMAVETPTRSRIIERFDFGAQHERDGVRLAAKLLAQVHNAANIRGKHVIGVLPHHLSSLAASVTEVQLDIPRELRGVELTAEQVGEYARGLHTYVVDRCDAYSRRWLAFREALLSANLANGVGIKFLSNDHAALIEVADVDGHRSVQVDLYRGALRTTGLDSVTFGPWLDPITGEPWRVASRVHRDEAGNYTNGPTKLIGGYPTETVEAKLGGFEAPAGPADPPAVTFSAG